MRKSRSFAAVVIAVAAVASTASRPAVAQGRECRLAPAQYALHSVRSINPDDGSVAYGASATSTLDCPDGHPSDGRPVEIRQRMELEVPDRVAKRCSSDSHGIDDMDFDDGDLRLRGTSALDVSISGWTESLLGRIAGRVVPTTTGTCDAILTVKAASRDVRLESAEHASFAGTFTLRTLHLLDASISPR